MTYRTMSGALPDLPPRDLAADRAVLRGIAWRYLLTPTLLDRSVYAAIEEVIRCRRAKHLLVQRIPQLHYIPSGAGRGEHEAPISPDEIDPWADEPARVAAQTRHVRACPECEGARACICADCDGTSRVHCRDCGGSGRTDNNTGCSLCGAGGKISCGECDLGRVPCSGCAASGTVEAWVEVEESTVTQVRVDQDSMSSEELERFSAAADFENVARGDGRLLEDRTLEGDLFDDPVLRAEMDPRTDRLMQTRVQTFEARSSQFDYATRLDRGRVIVTGAPPSVAGASTLEPLVRRRRLLARAAGVLALLFLVTQCGHATRDSWLLEHGHPGLVALASAAVAVSSLVVVALFLCAPEARRRAWGGSIVALGGCLLALFGAWTVVTPPSIEHAIASFEQGRYAEAKRELDAVTWAGTPGADDVLAKLVLDRYDRAPTLAAKSELLDGDQWPSSAEWKLARERFAVSAKEERTRVPAEPGPLRAFAHLSSGYAKEVSKSAWNEAASIEVDRAIDAAARAGEGEREQAWKQAAALMSTNAQALTLSSLVRLAKRMSDGQEEWARELVRRAAKEPVREQRVALWTSAERILTAMQEMRGSIRASLEKARTDLIVVEPAESAALLGRLRNDLAAARAGK